jgi:hypothetical protein
MWNSASCHTGTRQPARINPSVDRGYFRSVDLTCWTSRLVLASYMPSCIALRDSHAIRSLYQYHFRLKQHAHTLTIRTAALDHIYFFRTQVQEGTPRPQNHHTPHFSRSLSLSLSLSLPVHKWLPTILTRGNPDLGPQDKQYTLISTLFVRKRFG